MLKSVVIPPDRCFRLLGVFSAMKSAAILPNVVVESYCRELEKIILPFFRVFLTCKTSHFSFVSCFLYSPYNSTSRTKFLLFSSLYVGIYDLPFLAGRGVSQKIS